MNHGSVGFNLRDVEEHFVDLLVVVDVRASQVVALAFSFFHFEAVHNCKGDIGDKHWLYLCIHAVDLPVHAVEHLHVHAPLGCDGWVLMQQINHISGSKDSNVGVNCLHFLLANPFGAQTFRLTIGVSASSRDVYEALHVLAIAH